MTSEFDINFLLGVAGVSVAPKEAQLGKEIVDYDYEEEVKKVRNAYFDLLNKYGQSSGDVIEERRYPNPKFSRFRITSKRRCPNINVRAEDKSASIYIYLESFEHTEWVAKPYDPTMLRRVFPDDQIRLETRGAEESSLFQKWEDRTFYIGSHGVDRFTSSSTDFPVKGYASIENILSRKRQVTPEELEMLSALCPFLEAKYQSMQSSLPSMKDQLPSPRFGFFKKLLPKRFD